MRRLITYFFGVVCIGLLQSGNSSSSGNFNWLTELEQATSFANNDKYNNKRRIDVPTVPTSPTPYPTSAPTTPFVAPSKPEPEGTPAPSATAKTSSPTRRNQRPTSYPTVFPSVSPTTDHRYALELQHGENPQVVVVYDRYTLLNYVFFCD